MQLTSTSFREDSAVPSETRSCRHKARLHPVPVLYASLNGIIRLSLVCPTATSAFPFVLYIISQTYSTKRPLSSVPYLPFPTFLHGQIAFATTYSFASSATHTTTSLSTLLTCRGTGSMSLRTKNLVVTWNTRNSSSSQMTPQILPALLMPHQPRKPQPNHPLGLHLQHHRMPSENL